MNKKVNFDLISIVGPTASGKTDLAIKLAQKFNGEIISADSMQIYKEFNVFTAKPTDEELGKVPHHLINVVSIKDEFSVADFVKSAEKCVEKIRNAKKLPVLVGGTGLYVDSLLNNIDFEEKSFKNNSLRIKLQSLENSELMKRLLLVDKMSAEKIHINDKKRLVRALEFFYTAGYPISKQVINSRNSLPKYNVFKIGLNFRDRKILHQRINSRVEKMFDLGAINEVRQATGLNPSKTAECAIGYKEILDYIQGKCTLEEAKEKLKSATRQYAKRQLTWFRRDKNINWIYVDDFENENDIKIYAEKLIENFN